MRGEPPPFSPMLTRHPYIRPAARHRRRVRWGRLLLWGLAVAVLPATALLGGSYLWFQRVVSEASNGASVAAAREVLDNRPPAGAIALPAQPQGMDLLVLGSDKRSTGTETYGRSDSLMLVHVDPTAEFISVLSLPRDLRVEVPGHGFQKINAAYAIGGAALAIETVQNLTGVDVDHYLEIDFSAFEDVTEAIGGVYIDVDRRYYYDGPDYENIKLAPGYQLLSGEATLDYVRFRHDDRGDFGRLERQQQFLRAVREQAMGWDLAFKLPGLVKNLFRNVSTEISTAEVIRLASWLVNLGGGQIKQVALAGDIKTIDGVSYVISSDKTIEETATDVLSPPAPAETLPPGGVFENSAPAAEQTVTSAGQPGEPAGEAPSPDRVTDGAKWRALAAEAGFALWGPTYVPSGYVCTEMRAYQISTGSGTEPAVKLVYRYEDKDLYIGLTETTWLDAPAASPGETLEYGGLAYTVVEVDAKVDRIWWKKDGVLSWVSNTLYLNLDREELLAIARSAVPVSAR